MTPKEQRLQVCQFWDILSEPDTAIELRGLEYGSYKLTMAGYFTDPAAFWEGVKELSGKAVGVYATLNPVFPSLLARGANRIQRLRDLTKDHDTLQRRLLLLDCDPCRPSGISSTESEHQAAIAKACEVRHWLKQNYDIVSALADSGNGAHILMRYDLPNNADSADLVRRILSAVAKRFDDDVIKVDKAVFNASRISKVYGSLACKGDNLPERPHRYARFLELPDDLPIIGIERLKELAAESPELTKTVFTNQTKGGGRIDVPDFIQRHGLTVIKENDKGEWHHWILEQCPFDPQHDKDSMITQHIGGALTFKCLHNGCIGKGWHELRLKFEPDAYNRTGSKRGRLHPVSRKASQEPAQEAIEASLDSAKKIAERSVEDTGAPFEPESLRVLCLVQKTNPAEWQRIRAAFKASKVSVGELDKAIKEFREPQSASPDFEEEEEEAFLFESVLPDVPCSGLIIPPGYQVSENSIYLSLEKGEDTILVDVALAPVILTARLLDIDENSESFRAAWRRPQGWKQIVMRRSIAFNSQNIVSQADQGFPVCSDNARPLVKYLHEFEAINFDRLPAQNTSNRLGWQGDGTDQGFLWGKTYITPEGNRMPAEEGQAAIAFHPNDAGSEQIARAFHSDGSLEQWKRTVSDLDRFPKVQLALYASFVPPLLPILGAPNLILDWANRTSTGKTTTLRIAGSVWGNPCETDPDSVVSSWDATRVWIERASSMLNGLPLLLDDTKRAKKPEQVAQVLYDVANGRGRGRGNLQGVQRIRAWRTVLLSTGEAPAVSVTQDGGTRTRCIEVQGGPFGKDTEDTAAIVRTLNRRVMENYGHAGPAFVEWLIRNRERWPSFKSAYRQDVANFASENGPESRMAEHLALLRLTGMLVQSAGLLPWTYDDIPSELKSAILAEVAEASGESRALREVISWAYSHENQFIGRFAKDAHFNTREPLVTSGKWETDNWTEICFFPNVLRETLTKAGFDAGAILNGWREMGWIDTGGDRNRTTKRISIAGEKVWMVVLKREHIDEHG